MPPKSDIWKYFAKQSKNEARCKVCGKIIKTSGNTSNLRGHFKIHGNVCSAREAAGGSRNNDLPQKKIETVNLIRSTSSETSSVELSDDASMETTSVCSVSSVANVDVAVASPHCSTSTIASSSLPMSVITPNSPLTPQSSKYGSQSQSSIKSSFLNIKSFHDGGTKHLQITNAIVKFICRDNLPFSTVDGTGFKNLMKVLAPHFKVPARNTIKTKILDLYDVQREKFKEELKHATDITITTDIWTETMSMKSFLGVTIHFLKGVDLMSVCLETLELSECHTAQYVADMLLSVFQKWGVKRNNIVAVVTDNDAKMVKAVNIIFGPNRHISCFAHTINLTVENGIKASNIDSIISKVRDIVLFFKRSTIASDDLRKKQHEKGSKGGDIKRLLLDVKTRWNSTFYMVERFLLLLQVVNDILLTKPTSPPMLSALEVESLKECNKILGIFEKVTVEASGQNYVTLSKVIPMANCLKQNLKKINIQNEEGKRLKEALNKEITKRFGTIENAHLVSLSTILDPRFKTIHHTDPVAISKSVNYIKKIVEENVKDASESQENTPSSSNKEPAAVEPDQELDIWHYHKRLVEDKNKNCKTRDQERECSELSLYLKNPVVDLHVNPLQAWEEYKHLFPKLYPIARKYISPVGTSVPSERQFSRASAVITPARNRLLGDSLSKLIFLGSLPDEYWFNTK